MQDHPDKQRLGALHQTLDDSIKLIGGGLLFNGQVLILIRPVTGTTSNLTIALIRWALSQLNSELSAKACLAITRR